MSDKVKAKKPQGNFNITLYDKNSKFINDAVETRNVTKVAAINDCVEFARENEKSYKEFLVTKFQKSLQPSSS